MELHEAAPAGMTPETRMPDAAPNPELLRSLGRLVRGLSALFWGLPAALILCIEAAKTDMLRTFNVWPAVITTSWLVFALWQMGYFQKQERVWVRALDRARLLALTNLGLSPFLYWGSRLPDQPFLTIAVKVAAITGLLFLDSLNLLLRRLSAMLPDENLRQETRHFTTLNRVLLLGIVLLCLGLFAALKNNAWLPPLIGNYLPDFGLWMVLFLLLLPLAITLALIWKIKEVILDSVFGA